MNQQQPQWQPQQPQWATQYQPPIWPQPVPPVKHHPSRGNLVLLLILLVLILPAGAALVIYAPFFGDAIASLQPRCYVGATGTAASITIRSWTAYNDCDQIIAGSNTSLVPDHSLSFYRLTEAPQQPVVCEVDYEGRHLIIRDEGIFKLVGNGLCSYFLRSNSSSHANTSPNRPSYKSVDNETVAHFLSGDSNSSDHVGYLQMENDPNLYIVYESDFIPTINGNSFGNGDIISFVYRTDETTSIDVSATNTNTHLQGDAYTIEQITVFGSSSQKTVYTSSQYTP